MFSRLGLDHAHVEFLDLRLVRGLNASTDPVTAAVGVDNFVHPKACGGVVRGRLLLVTIFDLFQ